jgi:predicted enzyme related to lactoylglutathione lyase
MTMIQKVAFTMYPVVDMARARAFYEQTLGLTVSKPHAVWTEYDMPGGGCLALFATKDMTPSSAAGGIALEVADLDALTSKLETAGVTFKAKLIHSPVCRMTVVVDSEGNSIILHQLKPKA